MALAADTILHTLRGPRLVSKVAVTEQDTYCFQVVGETITVGQVYVVPNARRAQVWRVVLDDGTSLRVTPDQAFALRDGSRGVADKLAPNTSLMPLRLSTRRRDRHPLYRRIVVPPDDGGPRCDRQAWRCVARMVHEWATNEQLPRGVRVQHKDGDPQNCEPSNLELVGRPRPGNVPRRLRMARRVWQPNNHRVVGAEPFGDDDVYDVLVQIGDTFAAGGIFLLGAYGGT